MRVTSLEDVIALGSSCRSLAAIVGQASLWRRIFSKIQLVERGGVVMPGLQRMQAVPLHGHKGPGKVIEDRVRTMATFLGTLKDSEAILFLLYQMIYERYPGRGQGKEEDRVTVSFPSSPQLHTVSGLGLELLALTGRKEVSHSLHKIQMYTISPSVLLAMASLQRTKMLELVAGHVSCSTEE